MGGKLITKMYNLHLTRVFGNP